MASWKDFLTNASADAETQFNRLKNRLSGRLDAEKPYKIVYYRGFGGPTHASPATVWLKGRVLRERDLSTPSDNDTFWQNLLATYQRFESDEVPGVTVRVEAFGETHTTVTDNEGYFDLTINSPTDLPPGRVWFPIRYSLDGVLQPAGATTEATQPVFKDGYMMISPAFSQFVMT